MKKRLSVLGSLSVLAVLALPLLVLAQAPPAEVTGCTMRHNLTGTAWTSKGFICPAVGSSCPFDSTTFTCAVCCLMDSVYTVTDWIFVGITFVAVVMVLLGAYNMVTAAGNPEKVTAGKNYILWAAIGFIVALMARAIPAIARNILGM